MMTNTPRHESEMGAQVLGLQETYSLEKYCSASDFMGWDPYDGLESRLFKCTPFNQSAFCRLAWIQLFKRNPWNLRKAVGVGKGHNAKGLGLFLSGYSLLALHRKAGGRALPDVDLIDFKIHKLAELLIDMAVPDKSGACWGYNFAWQARGGLYFPKNTPTVVATTYAACGLFDAYEATGKAEYLDVALSSANFVLHDLSGTMMSWGISCFRIHQSTATMVFTMLPCWK